MTETTALSDFIARHNISADISAPWAHYDRIEDWPAIAYRVTLFDQERGPGDTLTMGKSRAPLDYKLGTGHVNPNKVGFVPKHLESAVMALKSHKRLIKEYRRKEAEAALWIAKRQKVTPGIDDVLDTLRLSLCDFYNRLSLEDFCAEYGYDIDSKKSDKLYTAVIQEGRETYEWLGEARAVELMNCESL